MLKRLVFCVVSVLVHLDEVIAASIDPGPEGVSTDHDSETGLLPDQTSLRQPLLSNHSTGETTRSTEVPRRGLEPGESNLFQHRRSHVDPDNNSDHSCQAEGVSLGAKGERPSTSPTRISTGAFGLMAPQDKSGKDVPSTHWASRAPFFFPM